MGLLVKNLFIYREPSRDIELLEDASEKMLSFSGSNTG